MLANHLGYCLITALLLALDISNVNRLSIGGLLVCNSVW